MKLIKAGILSIAIALSAIAAKAQTVPSIASYLPTTFFEGKNCIVVAQNGPQNRQTSAPLVMRCHQVTITEGAEKTAMLNFHFLNKEKVGLVYVTDRDPIILPSGTKLYTLRYMGQEDAGKFKRIAEHTGFCTIGGQYSVACFTDGDYFRFSSINEK